MSDNRKDTWDVLNILSTLVIAGMVGYWGYTNDQRQQEVQGKYNEAIINLDQQRLELEKLRSELNLANQKIRLNLDKQKYLTDVLNKDEDQMTQRLAVITTLIPYVAKNEQSRKVAIIALSKLGSEELAMEFARAYSDLGSKEAGDEIQQHGISEEQGAEAVPMVTVFASYDPKNSKSGWMYLGRREGGKWSGNYAKLDDNYTLDDLVDKIVSVRNDVSGVNIRTS